jgi:hypothetical protein
VYLGAPYAFFIKPFLVKVGYFGNRFVHFLFQL